MPGSRVATETASGDHLPHVLGPYRMTLLLAGTAVASVVLVGLLAWPPRGERPGSMESVGVGAPDERALADEVTRNERLADPETATCLNALLPPGHRVIGVPIWKQKRVDPPSIVSVLNNRPGSHIDLLVSSLPLTPRGTTTLLKGVPVLHAYVDDPPAPVTELESELRPLGATAWVVLSMTDVDAQKVERAREGGWAFYVAVRNDLRGEFIRLPQVDIRELRSSHPMWAPQLRRRPPKRDR